jgi:RimJ/RimL family protein N-acetyltransferase
MTSWLGAAPPGEITAAGVRLRRWTIDDAEVVVRLVTDNIEHLRDWMPWAQEPPSLERQRAFLEGSRRGWESHTDFNYAVTLTAGGPIGSIGLHTRQARGTLEIGYWLAAGHTGRGYMTEAVRALTGAAFALPGVRRVEIHCDQANQRSAAVPARLGYRLAEVIDHEPMAPGETGRRLVWAAERRDWPAPRRAR